jgi:nucleoside-triphosphatase THEP1
MQSTNNPSIYYRLVALWVLCEAMLGGVIHGLKLPVSGLFVGGAAVVCISMLAWYVPGRGVLLKATITVAVFKMMLSPQAPPPAYIAVFFQGLLGELLFLNKRYFKAACLLLAILAMLESALQRILVLTIVYGNDLWNVVNQFINGMTGQTEPSNYSWWIGAGYVVIHIIAGALIGYWAGAFPGKVARWTKNEELLLSHHSLPTGDEVKEKRKSRSRLMLFIIWGALLLLLMHSWLSPGDSLIPKNQVVRILIRSVLIVLTWYFLLSRILTKVLHRWLKAKKSTLSNEIEIVLRFLPAMKSTIRAAWVNSSDKSGFARLVKAVKIIVVNTVVDSERRRITILTGMVHTGKTTALMQWVQGRDNVRGVLTPVVDGRRMFFDIQSRHVFPMEAGDDEAELVIGKYKFSAEGFARADMIIRKSFPHDGWVVIDEIGPLELGGEGFAAVLKDLLSSKQRNILLVVRDKDDVLQRVLDKFNINGAIVINSVTDL